MAARCLLKASYLLLIMPIIISCGQEQSLQDSVFRNDIRSVEYLIKKGVDVNQKNIIGVSPLCTAIMLEHSEIVRLLIENGANVNSIYGDDRWTALQNAANKGRPDLVKLLVENGADVDARNNYGQSALHLAARQGHKNIVVYLISKSAAINTRTNGNNIRMMGDTPLHCANYDIAEILLRNGAEVNAKDKDGVTPLHMAIILGDVELTILLLDNGADIECKDSFFFKGTPLYWTAGIGISFTSYAPYAYQLWNYVTPGNINES